MISPERRSLEVCCCEEEEDARSWAAAGSLSHYEKKTVNDGKVSCHREHSESWTPGLEKSLGYRQELLI